MKPLRVDVILAFLLLAALVAACGAGAGNTNTVSNVNSTANTGENANTPKTNPEELGVLINIPYEAEDIAWKEDASHKKLIAVLRFSNADCDKIVADAARYRAPQNVSIQSESWFPDELIAQGEMSGDDTLKGISYGANAFLQEPFNEGRIIRIEGTSYFVVEASAK